LAAGWYPVGLQSQLKVPQDFFLVLNQPTTTLLAVAAPGEPKKKVDSRFLLNKGGKQS